MWETQFQSLGREDPLEKEMTICSNILAWRIPWTEVPGGLQSMGSQSWTRLNANTFTKHLKGRGKARGNRTQRDCNLLFSP